MKYLEVIVVKKVKGLYKTFKSLKRLSKWRKIPHVHGTEVI